MESMPKVLLVPCQHSTHCESNQPTSVVGSMRLQQPPTCPAATPCSGSVKNFDTAPQASDAWTRNFNREAARKQQLHVVGTGMRRLNGDLQGTRDRFLGEVASNKAQVVLKLHYRVTGSLKLPNANGKGDYKMQCCSSGVNLGNSGPSPAPEGLLRQATFPLVAAFPQTLLCSARSFRVTLTYLWYHGRNTALNGRRHFSCKILWSRRSLSPR